jgi:hypothetical protein
LEVSSQVNSVALVGGTLNPIEDIKAQLTSSDHILVHINNHAILPGNSLTTCCKKEPNQNLLRFDYRSWNSKILYQKISDLIRDLSLLFQVE